MFAAFILRYLCQYAIQCNSIHILHTHISEVYKDKGKCCQPVAQQQKGHRNSWGGFGVPQLATRKFEVKHENAMRKDV